MSVLEQAQRLAASGRTGEAVRLVEEKAQAGNEDAVYALANWRLFGLNGPRDPSAAHALLDCGVAAHNVEAIRLKAALVANGTGCASDPKAAASLLASIRAEDTDADRQLQLVEAMELAEGTAPAVEPLSDRPLARFVRGLLSGEECRYLVERAAPRVQPSFVVHPQTRQRIPHPVRTSSGMNFGPTLEDLPVHLLNRRIAEVTGTQIECSEPLQVLRYAPGQEYRPHMDALPAANNQRDWTVLVYLNDDYSGGETLFLETGTRFAGRTGDALIFRNVGADGESDPLSRHAGLPVTRGVKWLATRWIRRNRFDPWQDFPVS